MCGERDSWGKNKEDEYILFPKYITYNRVDIFQKSQNDFIWLDLLFFFTISHLKVWFLFITTYSRLTNPSTLSRPPIRHTAGWKFNNLIQQQSRVLPYNTIHLIQSKVIHPFVNILVSVFASPFEITFSSSAGIGIR